MAVASATFAILEAGRRVSAREFERIVGLRAVFHCSTLVGGPARRLIAPFSGASTRITPPIGSRHAPLHRFAGRIEWRRSRKPVKNPNPAKVADATATLGEIAKGSRQAERFGSGSERFGAVRERFGTGPWYASAVGLDLLPGARASGHRSGSMRMRQRQAGGLPPGKTGADWRKSRTCVQWAAERYRNGARIHAEIADSAKVAEPTATFDEIANPSCQADGFETGSKRNRTESRLVSDLLASCHQPACRLTCGCKTVVEIGATAECGTHHALPVVTVRPERSSTSETPKAGMQSNESKS